MSVPRPAAPFDAKERAPKKIPSCRRPVSSSCSSATSAIIELLDTTARPPAPDATPKATSIGVSRALSLAGNHSSSRSTTGPTAKA